MVGRIGKVHSHPCALACSDTAYRLLIKLHDEDGDLVAHCRLPYEFIVKAHLNRVSNASNNRRRQALPPGLNLPSVTALEPLSLDNSSHMDPFLRRISPADGPTSGGMTILISGINFPPPTQQIVYVKFGNLAVPSV